MLISGGADEICAAFGTASGEARPDLLAPTEAVMDHWSAREVAPVADLDRLFGGIANGAVAVVGDSAHDIAMARAAGAGLAIAVRTGPTPESHLTSADVIVDDIAAACDWLATRGHLSDAKGRN